MPLARCHPLISDSALNAMDQENTAMAMNLQPLLQSPLPSNPSLSPHHPLAPAQWHTFASLVKRPCLWRTTLPTPSKSVVKIPLKYRLPTPKTDTVAEGMGLQRGRGQRGRPRQPVAVHYAVPPAHPRHANRGAQAARRPLSPAAQGYENNQGTSYVPFTILDATGRQVPARFIKVHMTDNPYVEARMTMDGPVHRGEIHAAAVHDRVGRTPDIGPDELRLIDCSYQDWIMVDEAIAHIGDRSLTAEVMRWQGTPEADEGSTRVD
jgi:hypothetical protein